MAGLSGAMLLLLLASTLLLVPFCGSQRLYGKSLGDYFYISHWDGNLQGIRLYTGGRGVYGIQLMFGGTWSNVQGSRRGTKEEFLLEEDEAVNAVEGSGGKACFRSLTIYTNKARKVTLGRKLRPQFSESAPTGQQLEGIVGIKFCSCILAMGFAWGEEHPDWKEWSKKYNV